jgi:hypothetical protein
MRRLLYFGAVIVVLAATGLVSVRVTTSGAYLARKHAQRLDQEIQRASRMEAGIMVGLPRREVLRLMEQAPSSTSDFDSHISDEWWFDSYRLSVGYDPHGPGGKDLMNARAFCVDVMRRSPESTFDRLLEYLGLPHAGPWGEP